MMQAVKLLVYGEKRNNTSIFVNNSININHLYFKR